MDCILNKINLTSCIKKEDTLFSRCYFLFPAWEKNITGRNKLSPDFIVEHDDQNVVKADK